MGGEGGKASPAQKTRMRSSRGATLCLSLSLSLFISVASWKFLDRGIVASQRIASPNNTMFSAAGAEAALCVRTLAHTLFECVGSAKLQHRRAVSAARDVSRCL